MSRFVFDPATGLILPQGARARPGKRLCSAGLGPAFFVTGGGRGAGTNVLLLNFNGTNGATTFTDSSTYGRTVTGAGSAQLSTSQYQSSPSSLLLNGSTDYVTVADSADFDFGSGDFTVKVWFQTTSSAVSPGQMVISKGNSSGMSPFRLEVFNRALTMDMWNSGGGVVLSGIPICGVIANTSYAVELCRHGGVVTVRVNGFCYFAGAFTGAVYADTSPVQVGALSLYSAQHFYLTGYVDDVDLEKGLATYTGGANVVPFATAVVLQLHFEGANNSTTFTDSSTYGRTATVNGSAKISTTQYRAGSSSGRFDGTTNCYLTFPTSTDLDFTGDWAIFFSAKFDDTTTNGGIVHRGFYNSSTSVWTTLGYSIRKLGNLVRFYFSESGTGARGEVNVDVSTDTAWHDWAMVKIGGVGYVMKDGVVAGSVTAVTELPSVTATLRIGTWDYSAGSNLLIGYIDELRMVKGYGLPNLGYTVSLPFADS